MNTTDSYVDKFLEKTLTALQKQKAEEEDRELSKRKKEKQLYEEVAAEDLAQCSLNLRTCRSHLESVVNPKNRLARNKIEKLFQNTPIHYGRIRFVTIFRENPQKDVTSNEIVLSLKQQENSNDIPDVIETTCQLITLRWDGQMHHIEMVNKFHRESQAYKKLVEFTRMDILLEHIAEAMLKMEC